MRFLWLVLASCVQPAQPQPSYFQPQPGPPPTQAPAPASCRDTLQCYTQCNPFTQECVAACDQRTTPASSQNAHAVLQCMSGCGDQSCVAQRCNPQLQVCTNEQLAVTPTPPPAAGPDAVMQPEYYVGGTLKVPPPRRILGQADFAGEWSNGDGAIRSYVTSNGQYAGFRGVSTSEAWRIDAQGNFSESFKAGYSGIGGTRGVSENSTGRMIANGDNTVSFAYPAQNGIAAHTDNFIVTGWFVGPDSIFLKLQGPFARAITQQDFANTESNRYLDKTFVKRR